jgi:hypothetical protein
MRLRIPVSVEIGHLPYYSPSDLTLNESSGLSLNLMLSVRVNINLRTVPTSPKDHVFAP